MYKVSVCISVHNTAKYLPRCLDSVCSQTLKSLEIILVNNGSTDNSEEIMLQYVRLHPERCIKVFSQEDRGLAQGRQSGVNHATGEFITFLDADDIVYPNAYELMLKCAENKNVDIVEIETVRGDDILGSKYTGLHNSHDILRDYYSTGRVLSMLWLRLYHRKLFDKPVLPDLYTNNEDCFALPCLLFAAKSIYFIKEPLHVYSIDNENAVMQTETNNPELAGRRFESRRKALLAYSHFRSCVGEKGYQEYYHEINTHEAIYIFEFLLVDFKGKTIKDKEEAVLSTIEFSSKREMYHYLKKWLPKGHFNTYFVFRLFGFNVANKFNHLIHK